MTSQAICVRLDTDDSQFLRDYIGRCGIPGFDGRLMSVQMAVVSIVHNFVLQEREVLAQETSKGGSSVKDGEGKEDDS